MYTYDKYVIHFTMNKVYIDYKFLGNQMTLDNFEFNPKAPIEDIIAKIKTLVVFQ